MDCIVVCQAPLSIGFSQQEYQNGLPFSPSGDLPDPGIEPVPSALAGRFFTTEPPGKPHQKIEQVLVSLFHLLSNWGSNNSLINGSLLLTKLNIKKIYSNYQSTLLPPEKSICRSRSNRTGHGKMDWFQIGKGVQGCILSPCLFNLYAEYIKWNAGLDEAQAGIKIARRNINYLRFADNTTLMAINAEELKSLLMKVKEESEKAGLKQH